MARKLYEGKTEEYDQVDRELRKLQEKFRTAMENEGRLAQVKDHLEASIRQYQEKYQEVATQQEEMAEKWK